MRNPPRLLLVLCLLLFGAEPRADAARQPGTPDAITPGVPIERTTAKGELRTFALLVTEGSAITLTVDQHGADVQTTFSPPDGPSIVVDLPERGRLGRERMVWAAPSAGTVTLAIRTTRTAGPTGRYVLQVSVLDPVDGLDAAVRAINDAARTPDSGPAAAAVQQALGASLDLWRRLDEPDLVAQGLIRLGRLQTGRLQRPLDAVRTFTEAAAAYEALGLDVDVVEALLLLGGAQRQAGAMRDALDTYERAQARSANLDPRMRAVVESDLGRAFAELGDAERGVEHATRAIAAFKAEGAMGDAVVSLERLADSYISLRRLDEALESATEALTLAPQHGKPGAQASLTRTLGRIHSAAGDDQAAIAAFRRTADLVPADSLDRQILELDIARQLNRRADHAAGRDVLEAALSRVPAQQQNAWAAMASELGFSLAMLGDTDRALALQTKAHAIVKAGGSARNEIVVLRDLAATHRARHDVKSAQETTARLAELAGALPGSPFAAIVLREQARDARLAGDLPLARQFADLAIADIESARAQLRSQALRTAFGGSTRGYYDEAIDLAMAMHAAEGTAGHDARALTLFERSRARSLSELLADARADIRVDLDPALVAQERGLRREIALADAAIRTAGSDDAGRARVAGLEAEIEGFTRQLAVLDAQARERSPRYRAATRPALSSLGEIQALLDDDTVLLAYSLGLKNGWGWAVTRGSVKAFPVGSLATVDAAARRVVDAVRQPVGVSGASAEADSLAVATASLSTLVLGPIAGALAAEWRGHRLAIVASGPLEYVPFAALSLPTGDGAAAAAPRWLAEAHEIVQLPSASVLALLREERPARRTPAGGLVVVADPVYSASDPRVRARPSTRREPRAVGTLAARQPDAMLGARGSARDDSASGDLARLLFSRQEARALAQIGGSIGVVQALDFDASLETLKGPAVAGARLVHLATHGILNASRPERSGLVLSLVDRQGRPRDGVLRLDDIFALTLSADLVVLSGCETGLGRQMRSEGLVGLTRAFMYAGAPRIVSSLWQVDDQATAQLMTRFYRHMLQGGARPAAALRRAQMELARDPRWAAPYFWAGFVLQGEWR